jgi:hypothetical protein
MTITPKSESQFERFSRFVRSVLNVPHSEVMRKLEAEK